MLRQLANIIKILFLVYIVRVLSNRERHIRKYPNSDLCTAKVVHNILVLSVLDTAIELPLETRSLNILSRNMVGQVIFTRYGFPKVDKKSGAILTPNIKLILHPSILAMGVEKLAQFIKDWPGTSKASRDEKDTETAITVVIYSL